MAHRANQSCGRLHRLAWAFDSKVLDQLPPTLGLIISAACHHLSSLSYSLIRLKLPETIPFSSQSRVWLIPGGCHQGPLGAAPSKAELLQQIATGTAYARCRVRLLWLSFDALSPSANVRSTEGFNAQG
jgi:hypothetical protein